MAKGDLRTIHFRAGEKDIRKVGWSSWRGRVWIGKKFLPCNFTLHLKLEMRLIARKDEVDEELGNLKRTLKT